MNTNKFRKRSVLSVINLLVVVSLLAWTLNFSAWVGTARAAQLTGTADTLSTSNNAVKSNHTVTTTLKSAISASSTFVIDFADAFSTTSSPAFANTDATDYDIATSTANNLTVVAAGACPGSGNAQFEITSISAVNVFTFTHCNGTDPVATSTPVTVKIGTNATFGGTGDSQLVNPVATGSYVITVTAPSGDTADTRVAIIPSVTVSATVATNLTFTITGVASGSANANDQPGVTSITTTATTIPWSTLTTGVTSTARQDLAVTTNARNGFTVTIIQDQDLTAGNGAIIDAFQNAVLTAPQTWTSPTGTLDVDTTYGHEGITSEDSTLSTGDTFGTALFRGMSSSTPREVFFHTGPANGTTANKGATKIGFQIEITALQEAASDYTQSITYVATPIF